MRRRPRPPDCDDIAALIEVVDSLVLIAEATGVVDTLGDGAVAARLDGLFERIPEVLKSLETSDLAETRSSGVGSEAATAIPQIDVTPHAIIRHVRRRLPDLHVKADHIRQDHVVGQAGAVLSPC